MEEKNIVTDLGTRIISISWIYSYMKKIPVDLISKIYLFISTIPLTTQYLASRAILTISNIDVTQFNNPTLKIMRKD